MSIWSRITTCLTEFGQNNPLVAFFQGPAEQSVGFTIAIISLCAKMAKADGRVTRDEVRILREIFDFREEDEDSIARVFDLARTDITGFEEYAQKIRKMFIKRPEVLNDIFEGLFQIAIADGSFGKHEDEFLTKVHEIFELPDFLYQQLKTRYTPEAKSEPLTVLGLRPGASTEEIRRAYHAIIRENHPDLLHSRGLTTEAIAMGETRMRAANEAYDALGCP